MNELFLKRLVHLVAQVVDVNFNDVGTGLKVDVPYLFGDFSFGNNPLLVADKIFHQGKFLWRLRVMAI